MINTTPEPARATPIKGIRLYFLGLVIAGAAAMGLTSVVALLVGGFNDYIGKVFLTILILIAHAVIALSLVAAARAEYIKRSILAVTLLAVTVADIVSSTLGLWNLIPTNLAWHILGFYFVVLGGAYIATWLSRALIGVRQSDTLFSTAVAVTVVFVGALAPWVLTEHPTLPSIYYRAVLAVLIVIVTLFVIGTILRQIYLSHGRGSKQPSVFKGMSPLLIVIYSVVGGLTVFVWLAGITGFSFDALGYTGTHTTQSSPYYNDNRDDDDYYNDDNGYDNGDSYDDGSTDSTY